MVKKLSAALNVSEHMQFTATCAHIKKSAAPKSTCVSAAVVSRGKAVILNIYFVYYICLYDMMCVLKYNYHKIYFQTKLKSLSS